MAMIWAEHTWVAPGLLSLAGRPGGSLQYGAVKIPLKASTQSCMALHAAGT